MARRFDKSAADRFLTAVRAGASDDVAAAHAGIELLDVRDWLDKKKDFSDEVRKARADLATLGIGIVRRAMVDDPRQAMLMAEKATADFELDRLRKLTT